MAFASQPQPPRKNSVVELLYLTTKTLTRYRAVLLPFFVFFLIESAALLLVYWFPRYPFVTIFGPPVKAFLGERFLHYPNNFLVLTKIHSISRFFLVIFAGSVLSGMAVAMIRDIDGNRGARVPAAWRASCKRYFRLFLAVAVCLVCFYTLVKVPGFLFKQYFISGHKDLLFLGPKFWLGPFVICVNFLISMFIQAAFFFVIPGIIIDDRRLIPSFLNSFVLYIKTFRLTTMTVFMAMLLYLPVIILQYNTVLMVNIYPESVLWVNWAGVFINSMAIDAVITISAAMLYLKLREPI